MLYAIVALLVIILDQWTKFWVAGHIALNTGSRDLIPGLLKIVNIHNDGAALGFLSGKNAGMLFIVLCAVFTIFVIVALATKLIKSSVGRWSLLFIMAGGLSNCIDRLLSGYVQDMFLPTFMDNLPIFNVADIFITVFCLVFILFVLFGGKSDEEDADDDEEEYEDDEDAGDDDLDEDEEEKPSRTHIKSVFKPRKVEDEDEDEDEDPGRRERFQALGIVGANLFGSALIVPFGGSPELHEPHEDAQGQHGIGQEDSALVGGADRLTHHIRREAHNHHQQGLREVNLAHRQQDDGEDQRKQRAHTKALPTACSPEIRGRTQHGSQNGEHDNPAPRTQEAQEGAGERRYGIEDGTSDNAQHVVVWFFHF